MDGLKNAINGEKKPIKKRFRDEHSEKLSLKCNKIYLCKFIQYW